MSFFTSVAEIDRMRADLPPVNGTTQNGRPPEPINQTAGVSWKA